MATWWMVVPGNPALSALILVFVLIPFLYAGRKPMHGVIMSLTRAISGPLRMGSRWLLSSAAELRARNRTVLMAHGREEVTQTLDREFERVSGLVQRDLAGYPELQRKLSSHITKIEEDYKKSGEVPPPTPEWSKAIDTIASLKKSSPSDGLVEKLLEDISKSMTKIYDKALGEYRKSYADRHKILKTSAPHWRSLDQSLSRVDKELTGLQQTASNIDNQMDKYKEIIAESEKAEHALTASASIQFAIAALVLFIAFGGALVNFKLIALPMSEMVGGGERIGIGSFSMSAKDIAALVIILVETTMGLFLMETARITHLFPRINNMHDRLRMRIFWISLTILTILALVEVALAVMRDSIVAEKLTLLQQLGDNKSAAALQAEVSKSYVASIPAAGQMVLGFILPFALAFIGIPLEYFIYSARTVLGVLLVLAIRSMAFVLRVLSHVSKQIGKTIVMFYDVLIFVPLMIERAVTGSRVRGGASGAQGSGVTSFSKRRKATGEL